MNTRTTPPTVTTTNAAADAFLREAVANLQLMSARSHGIVIDHAALMRRHAP